MIGIYKITNKLNNKAYIGQSICIEKRWENHKCLNGAKTPSQRNYNYPLYRAIRKYGIDNFNFEVIEECSKNELSEKELHYIRHYDCVANGYNQTESTINPLLDSKIMEKAIRNMKIQHSSIEHREKQRVISKKLWENDEYRKKVTNAIIAKNHIISKSSKHMWENNHDELSRLIKQSLNTKEIKLQRSITQKEKFENPEYRKRNKDILDKARNTYIEKINNDKEFRELIVLKARENSLERSKSIYMLDRELNYLKTFISLADATRWIKENTSYSKADYSTIRKAAKTNRNAYGYKWKLHESQETIRKE